MDNFNRIYAQFGGKELFDSCIYLIEYMLIIYFSHFFCTRIVILLTSVRGKRTEVKIRHPGRKIKESGYTELQTESEI